MTCTPADLPPEFAAVPEAVALYWIGKATAAVDARKWLCAGVDPDEGICALAAHYIKSDPASGLPVSAGTTTSKSIGGVSVGVTVGAEVSGKHGSTVYGRAYDEMLARVNASYRRHLPPVPQPAC